MIRFLAALIFVCLLFFTTGFAAQTVPNPDNFIIYGAPWAIVGVVIVGLLKRYAKLTGEGTALVSAGWVVLGYLVIQNLPTAEQLLPWLPTYLPQLLWAIILFGAQLGLVPGDTFNSVKARLGGGG